MLLPHHRRSDNPWLGLQGRCAAAGWSSAPKNAHHTPGPAPEGSWRCREWSLGPAASSGCERLRPQLLGLMETLGSAATTPASASQSRSVKGSSAAGLKPASDCVSERDRLDHIRAQPSADMAQQFWRDLQCERLRPQVRRLLESLNVAADPPGACRREAEELNRIRTNPNRREAEGFARDLTCDAGLIARVSNGGLPKRSKRSAATKNRRGARSITSASTRSPSAALQRSDRASSWQPLDRDFGPPFGEDRRLLRATKPS